MGLDLKPLLVREKTQLESFTNKIVAIDAYNAIYQFLASIRGPDGLQLTDGEGRITSHLSGLLYRNVNFLSLGIQPVYVFDGKPPSLKTAEIERRKQIKKEYGNHQIICCPHTATAFSVYRDFPDDTKDNNHWSLVSTAHPAKFENIVEPIIDEVIKVPNSLSRLLKLDSSFISIEPRLEKLMDIIL